jgi:hypothetical protein
MIGQLELRHRPPQIVGGPGLHEEGQRADRRQRQADRRVLRPPDLDHDRQAAAAADANAAAFDIKVNVHGGGESGQAGAVRHGITRALIDYDAALKPDLSHAGFVTRDAREVERKKVGLHGARRASSSASAEAENLELKADLGFFQRLLPAASGTGLTVRAMQATLESPGKTRYQLLVMQNGNVTADFSGHYAIVLAGTLDGRAWNLSPSGGAKPLQLRQYVRVDGVIEHPPQAVVKTIEVRVTDARGNVVATQIIKT